MRRSRIAYANEKVKKDVKKSPGSTGNKGGRKTKVSEDALKKSSANICAKLNLNVVELDYSEAEYQDAKSYKLFGAHIRPFILKDNPEISMTMMMTLIAAKWHEFKDSVYFKGDVNLVKTPQSLNLEDISEGEKGSKIRGRKRKIQSPDEAALEYEKKRLQNIAERMSFLESLNIHEAKENYVGTAQRGLKSSNKERVKWGTKEKEILPLRSPSMRLRKLDPAGEPLPDEVPTQKILSYEELHPRKPSGILSLSDIAVNESTKETSEELLKSLTELTKMKDPDNLQQTLESVEFLKSVLKLRLSPDHTTKVTRDRIFSLAINPCETKTVIVAGDKWGKIGIWDMDSSIGQDGVFCYEPHCRPINCLNFAPDMPWKFYSCSYDGTVRLGDLECGEFEEIYANDEADANLCSHFDFLSSSTLVVSQGDGTVVILDPRSRRQVSQVHKLHKKQIRTVSVHPVQKDYILTASADSSARLWDLRKMSKNTIALAELKHNKTVTSAYFSPITGNKILSCSLDDKLRIFDSTILDKTIKESRIIRHNNHAGRWLTKFRPVFHPLTEDVFVVGSMNRPREIEIYFEKHGHCYSLKSPNLTTISSLNVFHPTKNILAGCTSSGRVMVFKEE